MRVATFADAFNIPRAGYFHGCIIRGIKPHERHQLYLQGLCAGAFLKCLCVNGRN